MTTLLKPYHMMTESTRKSTINKGTDTNKAILIEGRHEVIYKANRKETIIIQSVTVLLSQPLMKGNCVITMTQYN